MTTIKLSELAAAQKSYEEAYEAGQTWTYCTLCERPLVEKYANDDFYPGAGIILHGECVRLWRLWDEAPTFFRLAVGEMEEEYLGLVPSKYCAVSLKGGTRRSTPREDGYVSPFGPPPDYMRIFELNAGIPSIHLGFGY